MLSLEVPPIVFRVGKGLDAKWTLDFSSVLVTVLFSQMTAQRVCSAEGFLTVLTGRHGGENTNGVMEMTVCLTGELAATSS